MTKTEELWLESKVRSRIEALCIELRWKCEPYGCYYEIWPPHDWYNQVAPTSGKCPLQATWVSVREMPYLELLLPIVPSPDHDRGPWVMEALQFFLRRNAQLHTLHWCITRHEGLAVKAVRDGASLTADGFRQTVADLIRERADLLALLSTWTWMCIMKHDPHPTRRYDSCRTPGPAPDDAAG
jgi:hypothetical protein